MSATLSRVILSMVVLLSAVAVYVPLFLFIEDTTIRGDDAALLLTNVLCGGWLILGWTLTWIKEIRWTVKRAILTIVAVAVGLIPGFLIPLVIMMTTGVREREIYIIFGAVIWASIWLTSTAFIWGETKRERAARLQALPDGTVSCPQCGYDLRGLREARCPECGTQYTIDQLLKAVLEKQRSFDH